QEARGLSGKLPDGGIAVRAILIRSVLAGVSGSAVAVAIGIRAQLALSFGPGIEDPPDLLSTEPPVVDLDLIDQAAALARGGAGSATPYAHQVGGVAGAGSAGPSRAAVRRTGASVRCAATSGQAVCRNVAGRLAVRANAR